MKFVPHDYQKETIRFILDTPRCGLFLDMGMGKTVSTLSAIHLLRKDFMEGWKVLIIAPRRVAIDTWPAEIEKWDHTKDFTYTMLTGPPKERRENLKKDVDIYITTRDLVKWVVDELGDGFFFDTVVIDELSSFKSHASKRFKKLKSVIGIPDRVIGLTGTPKPNGYEDLWSQIYLLDRGKRLEKNITGFRRKYFTKQVFDGFALYRLVPGMDKVINDKIKDLCISMKARDYLDLKEPVIIDHKISLDPKEEKKYKELERHYVLDLKDDTITAPNAAALSNKLQQLANGAVYDEEKKTHKIHDKKIEALKEIAEREENLLVFYNFLSDKKRILKALPEAVPFDNDPSIVKRWNNKEIKILLAHPASCGHGLNLQDGGHIVVWFGLTWSLELYQQANARLDRQGQKEPVLIYRLISKGTVDERILKALKNKNYTQEELLRELKAKFDR